LSTKINFCGLSSLHAPSYTVKMFLSIIIVKNEYSYGAYVINASGFLILNFLISYGVGFKKELTQTNLRIFSKELFFTYLLLKKEGEKPKSNSPQGKLYPLGKEDRVNLRPA
jgi:hypothetical protein